MSDRLIIYGDIHGELYRLQDLMNKISLSKKNDTLIFLGDYIDRGEHSRKVIDYILPILAEINSPDKYLESLLETLKHL